MIKAKERKLVIPGGRRKGVGWMGSRVFGCKLLYLEWDGQWGPIVQHRDLCVIGLLFCITDIEETL